MHKLFSLNFLIKNLSWLSCWNTHDLHVFQYTKFVLGFFTCSTHLFFLCDENDYVMSLTDVLVCFYKSLILNVKMSGFHIVQSSFVISIDILWKHKNLRALCLKSTNIYLRSFTWITYLRCCGHLLLMML